MKKVSVKKSYAVAKAIRGMRNEDVARKIPLKQATLESRIRSGNNIQVGNLIPIANALEFSLSDFMALGEE